eukprot:2586457-Pyramimonas_sp.AAC.1
MVVRAVHHVEERGARQESVVRERDKREEKPAGDGGGGGKGGRKQRQGAVGDNDGTGDEVTNAVTVHALTKVTTLGWPRGPPR